MSQTDDQKNDMLLLRRYLLGTVSEKEQCSAEQRLMTDQDYFNRLGQAEEELVDEYACGQICSEEKQLFESRFLDDPERRRDIRFARAFQQYLVKRSNSAPKPSLAVTAWPWWRMWMVSGLASAAFALALVSFLLSHKVKNLREQIAETERQREAAERQSSDLTQQIKDEQQEVEELQQQVSSLSLGGSGVPDHSDLIVWPGLNRGTHQVATVRLRSKAGKLRLGLQVEDSRYPVYQAELQTVEGSVIWRQDGLTAHSGRQGRQEVTLQLPTPLLVRSDYLVRLSGVRGQASNSLDTYYFKVVRKAVPPN
jgi:hypothetical protein